MSPSGYISLLEASSQLGIPTTEIRKVANTVGIRQYQSKGNIVYKIEDFEKVLAVLRPEGRPQPAQPSVVEDIDIESLFVGQQGGSVDSGLFDNTGLSGSGLFDATDAVRPQVKERLVGPTGRPDDQLRSGPVVKGPNPPAPPPGPVRRHDAPTAGNPAVPRTVGEQPSRVVQGLPKPPAPPASIEPPTRIGPGVGTPPRPPTVGEQPSRVVQGLPRPPTVGESPSRVMPVPRPPEQPSRVGPAAPAPARPTSSSSTALPARPPAVPAAPNVPAAPMRPAAPPSPAAKPAAGSSWVADWHSGSGGAAVSMDITNLVDEKTVAGGTAVDSVHQLFVDDSVVSEIKGLTRAANQPVKFSGNPVVFPDTAWEEDGLCSLSGTVLYDREEFRFKMWYYAVTKLGRAACYAVSPDGIRWEKPDCGLFPWEGAGTNVVMAAPAFESYAELCGVVKDTTDDPSRWYKAVYQYQNPQANVRGLRTAVSADGVRWVPSETLITQASETAHFLRDERTGKYVIYARAVKQGRRAVQRLESDDFKAWTAGRLVMSPDDKDPEGDDIYSLNVFPYGRQYLGLTQVFHGAPNYTLDVQLSVSRDGTAWERAAGRSVFLPLGKIGEWDRFQLSPSGRPAVIGGKELWFYYGCRAFRHPPYLGADKGLGWGGIGLARLRRDGFVHLEGAFDGGYVTTQTVVLRGPELRVNAAAAHGSVQVALLDKDNNPVDGMMGKAAAVDSVDAPVKWDAGKSLAAHLGKPVRLRFTLKNARLYSFWTQ
jgi:hypothetical protein